MYVYDPAIKHSLVHGLEWCDSAYLITEMNPARVRIFLLFGIVNVSQAVIIKITASSNIIIVLFLWGSNNWSSDSIQSKCVAMIVIVDFKQ